MKIAGHIKPAGAWDAATAIDRVALDADDRHRRRIMMAGEGGTRFLLDLDHATMLMDGDGLVLGDGAIVRVVAKPERLVEIFAANPEDRLRIAWHIGNRHTDVQVVGERLRIRRDHVLEDMLGRLGAELTPLEAPFEPEAGAYGPRAAHGHGALAHGHHDVPGHDA